MIMLDTLYSYDSFLGKCTNSYEISHGRHPDDIHIKCKSKFGTVIFVSKPYINYDLIKLFNTNSIKAIIEELPENMEYDYILIEDSNYINSGTNKISFRYDIAPYIMLPYERDEQIAKYEPLLKYLNYNDFMVVTKNDKSYIVSKNTKLEYDSVTYNLEFPDLDSDSL